MVTNCCVKKCKSDSYAGCGISFHSFPKDQNLRDAWVQKIKINPRKWTVVCSRHFKPDDFLEGQSRRLLKEGAVPTLLLRPEDFIAHYSRQHLQDSASPTLFLRPEHFIADDSSQHLQDSAEPTLLPQRLKDTAVPSSNFIACDSHQHSKDGALPTLLLRPGSIPVSSNILVATSTSQEQSEPKKQCSNVFVQTEVLASPEEIRLRRKVKVLSMRLKRRDIKINKFKRLFKFLEH